MQKSAMKGMAGDYHVFLDTTTYELSGDMVFRVILALSRLKILNHAHFYLACTGMLHSTNRLWFHISNHTTLLQYIKNQYNYRHNQNIFSSALIASTLLCVYVNHVLSGQVPYSGKLWRFAKNWH